MKKRKCIKKGKKLTFLRKKSVLLALKFPNTPLCYYIKAMAEQK